jgi:hypothetical protein
VDVALTSAIPRLKRSRRRVVGREFLGTWSQLPTGSAKDVQVWMLRHPTWRRPGTQPVQGGPEGLLGPLPFPAVGSGRLGKIHVRINGHIVVALLDSGCGACVAGESLVDLLEEAHLREYKTRLQYEHIDMTLTTAKKGERAGVLGTCEATLGLTPDISFRIQMLATRDISCQLVIGIDLLRHLGWRPLVGGGRQKPDRLRQARDRTP